MSEETKKPRNFSPRDGNKSNNAPLTPAQADARDRLLESIDRSSLGSQIFSDVSFTGSLKDTKKDRKKLFNESLHSPEYESIFSIIFNTVKWLTYRYPNRVCGNKEIWAEIQKSYLKQQQALIKIGDEESKIKMIKLMQTLPSFGSIKNRTGEMKKAGVLVHQEGAKQNFDYKIKATWLNSSPEQVVGVVRSKVSLHEADKVAARELAKLMFAFCSKAISEKDRPKKKVLWDKLGLIQDHINTTGHFMHFDDIAAIGIQLEALVSNHQKHNKELKRLEAEANKDFIKKSAIMSKEKVKELYEDNLEQADFKHIKKEDEDF